jgi:hypothetical protein
MGQMNFYLRFMYLIHSTTFIVKNDKLDILSTESLNVER